MLPQLVSSHIVRSVLKALIDLPADDLVRARRAHVVALRGPHHPLAVETAEQVHDQLARLEVPQTDGLVAAAGDQVTSVGRGGAGPHPARVADGPRDPL